MPKLSKIREITDLVFLTTFDLHPLPYSLCGLADMVVRRGWEHPMCIVPPPPVPPQKPLLHYNLCKASIYSPDS